MGKHSENIQVLYNIYFAYTVLFFKPREIKYPEKGGVWGLCHPTSHENDIPVLL